MRACLPHLLVFLQQVLHRDIKPANILLGAGQSVKLGDFGLARMLSENSRFATTNVGTPFYMSPEQIDEHPYDEKSDIWALGCVVYELCTLHPPFEALNQLSLAMKIRQHAHSPCAGYSAELMDIVDRCLVKDPSLRCAQCYGFVVDCHVAFNACATQKQQK